MKIYAEEYNFQNDSKLVEVQLFGLDCDWYEDYEEHGGLHFSELFTSYREATLWLLEQGYEISFDFFEHRVYGKQEITFEKYFDDYVQMIKIEEMEVVK